MCVLLYCLRSGSTLCQVHLLVPQGRGCHAAVDAIRWFPLLRGIASYEAVEVVCNEFGNAMSYVASGAKYTPDDLICFLCLSQHETTCVGGGMTGCEIPPNVAPPVSVKKDLFFSIPVSQFLARRFRDTTSDRFTMAPTDIHISLFVLLDCLQFTTARFICRCCCVVHVSGRFMPGRCVESKQMMADSVASILNPANFEDVPLKTLLHTHVCALVLFEKCGCVAHGEHLFSLVLLCLNVKFEFNIDDSAIVLTIIGTENAKPVFKLLESRLVRRLFSV